MSGILGTIRGIRARGGFTFDMVWEDSHIKELMVHSAIGGNCRIRSWDQLVSETALVPVETGIPNPNPLYHVNDVPFPGFFQRYCTTAIEVAPNLPL